MLMIVTGYTILQRRLYPATINVLLLGQVHSPFGTSTVRTPPQSSITPALVEHVRTYMGEDERENHWD